MTVERFGKRFIDKNVLVTGAARGIGKTIAMWFPREGARVALNDIKEADLEGTVQELRRYGRRSKDMSATFPRLRKCDGWWRLFSKTSTRSISS